MPSRKLTDYRELSVAISVSESPPKIQSLKLFFQRVSRL